MNRNTPATLQTLCRLALAFGLGIGAASIEVQAQTDGRVFGWSSSLDVEAVVKGNQIFFNKFNVTSSAGETATMECGGGPGSGSRLTISRSGEFEGWCTLRNRRGQAGGSGIDDSRRVSGRFPTIQLNTHFDIWGSFEVTFVAEANRSAYLAAKTQTPQLSTTAWAERSSTVATLPESMSAAAPLPGKPNPTPKPTDPSMSVPISIQPYLEAKEVASLPWGQRIQRAVQVALEVWLAEGSENLQEIPVPQYPAAISLRQERWETNDEFEGRLEAARAQRRNTIDALQADYQRKVAARNARVERFNSARAQKQTNLAEVRRSLVQAAVRALPPHITLKDPDLDQRTGALTLMAQIDGLAPQPFSFASTPAPFRKLVLTDLASLKPRASIEVGITGELVLSSLDVQSAAGNYQANPKGTAHDVTRTSASTKPPVTSFMAVAQQSAMLVDRNQVEQIQYREENDLLRKRLEDQRKQQEEAIAVQLSRAAAESDRLRAEAERLRKELASANQRPVQQYATIKEAHAVVIGNGRYSGGNRLANPINDAKLIASKLRSLGFKVSEVLDADRAQLVQVLSTFSKTASNADVALLFYAGHGVQVSGVNYMVPIDMNLSDASEIALQAISLNSVVEQYIPGKTKIVFLDACRDNPLLQVAGRGLTRGLAPISVAQGTLIAYATKDGQTADDGVGQKNSPFTAALYEHLADPDDISVILRKVREKVMQRTNGRQQPWDYGSLTGGALILSTILQPTR